MQIRMKKDNHFNDGHTYLMSNGKGANIIFYEYDACEAKKRVFLRVHKGQSKQEVGDLHHLDWAVRELLKALDKRLPQVDGRCYSGRHAYELEKLGEISPGKYVLFARRLP